MGVSKLNIWVSDVADACGTWKGDGFVTIFDCKGVLSWPCGRFLNRDEKWEPIPNGLYTRLPLHCGHLQVELPPGCYWVIDGYVSPGDSYIHLNYTTHVGVVQVCCDEMACIKLFNPSVRLCWNWFLVGLRVLAANGTQTRINEDNINALTEMVDDMLQEAPHRPIERVIGRVFDDLAEMAGKPGGQASQQGARAG